MSGIKVGTTFIKSLFLLNTYFYIKSLMEPSITTSEVVSSQYKSFRFVRHTNEVLRTLLHKFNHGRHLSFSNSKNQ